MRQRIIYILKHNAFLQKAYRITMSLIFRLLGMIIPTRDNEILFVSFMGKSFNDSPKVIYDYIQNEKDLKRYKCIWAFENPNHFSDLTTVKIDTPSYFIAALRAKYWITNTNIERGLRFKKKDQIYLNTWHGTTLKHIGNDVAGRNDFDFSTVDYLVVSGKYDEKIWKSAFNASERTYLRCGLPRNEELWYADENVKKKIRKKLNIPTDKKVILYAPTWRESTDGGKSYEINPPIHFEKWEELLGKDYIVLFRAHHLTTKVLGIKYNDFVRNFSDYPYVNDLMIASDYLITDYSAIAFDYSILCKPIFCYAYDYETYLNTRGTYFELDELYPNKSCRTEEELLNRIIQCDYEFECNNTMRFRNLFIQYGYGSTEKIISKLFKCEKRKNKMEEKNTKPIKMMYIGTLVNNLQDAMSVIFQAADNNGIEVYWVANFSGYKGNLEEIPCHVLQTDITRHPVWSKNNFRAIKQIKKYIREYNINMIHCNTPIGSFCARIASSHEKVPAVLYTAHGLPFYEGAPPKAIVFEYIEKWLAKKTDYAVAMNQEDYNSFKAMKLRKGKVFHIDGVGIPIRERIDNVRSIKREELGISEEAPVIICVGRFENVKGYPVSIRAFSKLKEKDAIMLICGAGQEEDNLKQIAKDVDCEDRVHFLGFRNDVFELLQASDIYLLTSYYEGLPRSVMEAMNAKVACIVSDARGNVDLIENQKNGLVVKRSSVDQTADAIETLIQDKALRARLAEQASIDVLKYQTDNIVQQYTDIYREVIETCIGKEE